MKQYVCNRCRGVAAPGNDPPLGWVVITARELSHISTMMWEEYEAHLCRECAPLLDEFLKGAGVPLPVLTEGPVPPDAGPIHPPGSDRREGPRRGWRG